MNTSDPTPTFIDLATSDLRAGDTVAAHKHATGYEVGTVAVQQGRVQIVDTTGGIHNYHRTACSTSPGLNGINPPGSGPLFQFGCTRGRARPAAGPGLPLTG